MHKQFLTVLLVFLVFLPAMADTCPQNPSGTLPSGWHCTGSNCQEGNFVHAAFAGHKKFGTITCFYENQGVKFSVYAWVSGGTKGEHWNPNAQGERCHKSIEGCEFGEVLTQ